MTEKDSFIEEVTEEVKRDRMFGLWRKYGVYVIGALVAIVLGAAASEWWKARKAEEAMAGGAAFLAAMNAADPVAELQKLPGAGYGLLGKLAAAQKLAAKGDKPGATALYDAVAASNDPILADFARLQAAMLRYDPSKPDETIAAASSLMAGDNPFKLLAAELLANAQIEAGDKAGAKATLEKIVTDTTAPNGLRNRALALQNALAE